MKHKKLNHYDNDTPIEKIHLVFLKLKKRREERRKIFTDFIEYITSIISPTDNRYNIFFNYPPDSSRKQGKIEISYNRNFNTWAYCTNEIKLVTRNDRLDYLEDTDLKFELGKKFKELENLAREPIYYYFEDVLLNKIINLPVISKKCINYNYFCFFNNIFC